MNTHILNYLGKQYLCVDLVQFVQKGQPFYLAKIKSHDFLKIYTVRPAQYDLLKHSSLAQSFPEDKDYYGYLISEDKENLKSKDFQRDPNFGRVNDIVKYLNTEEYAFFPNTIIANCDLINDNDEFGITEDSSVNDFLELQQKVDHLGFLYKKENKYSLILPFEENAVLVIDGQHRLKGLENSVVEVQQNYDLLIAFIIGYDRSIIAKQFYTINYEQKPVNKSLLYQLTGEFSRDVNEFSFMHNAVKLLNELEESPLYGRVKMLGTTPKNVSQDAKRKLSISQAFLVDSMMRFISNKAINTVYPPIFLKYYQNSDEHIIIIRSLARFFNAVRELKADWDTPETSTLSKGMGVGALLKVYNMLFPVIFCSELNMSWDKVKDLTISDYKRILSGLERVNFSSDGEFGRAGSAGSINRIKEAVIKNLDYLGRPESYQVFEELYKRDYAHKFNANLINSVSGGQMKLTI